MAATLGAASSCIAGIACEQTSIVGHDTTSLMIAYGHERWFRIASALAHGKEWGMAAMLLDRPAEPPLREKVGHGSFSASEPVALALTIEAMKAARAAVADLESYVTDPAKVHVPVFG